MPLAICNRLPSGVEVELAIEEDDQYDGFERLASPSQDRTLL